MKRSLDKITSLPDFPRFSRSSRHTTGNGKKRSHYYTRDGFWQTPANWFWESKTLTYSERGKQYFREANNIIL